MTQSDFQFEPIGEYHHRASFSCGVDVLDRYLREQAGQDIRRRLSAIFVCCEPRDKTLAGYYTLSACEIELRSLPSGMARKLPHRPLPATLIGSLAVDQRYHRQRLGGMLLINALTRSVVASSGIGAMAVIVDAKDDRARAFYEHDDFQRFADEPYRLFLPMADAERIAQITRRA